MDRGMNHSIACGPCAPCRRAPLVTTQRCDMRLIHAMLLASLILLTLPTPFAVGQTPTIDQAPVLTSPASGSTGNGSPTFEWQAVEGAAGYRIEIATDPVFTAIVACAETSAATYQEPEPFGDGLLLYWRVSASREGGGPG